MRFWYNWALYKRPLSNLYSFWYDCYKNKPNKNKSFYISKSVIRCNTVNVDQRMHVELWDRDSYLISTIFYFKSDDVIEEEVFFYYSIVLSMFKVCTPHHVYHKYHVIWRPSNPYVWFMGKKLPKDATNYKEFEWSEMFIQQSAIIIFKVNRKLCNKTNVLIHI